MASVNPCAINSSASRNPMRLFQFITAAVLVLGAWAGRADAQSPCMTNPDTAARFIRDVTREVTLSDSADVADLGLPYRPASGVTLVTDSTTCAAAVEAI